MIHVTITRQKPLFFNQEFATQFVGDFKIVNIKSHWLVDSVHYFKVESRNLLLNILVLNHNSGYDNRTRQTGQVIRDLYSPNSFYTRLGERASDNFQPCINTVCSLVNSEAERVYFF